MRPYDKDRYAEQKREDILNDLIGHMVVDNNICQKFLCWADEKYPATVQKYVNQWLESDKEAKEWFNNVLEHMVDNLPEPEREDEPGCER